MNFSNLLKMEFNFSYRTNSGLDNAFDFKVDVEKIIGFAGRQVANFAKRKINSFLRNNQEKIVMAVTVAFYFIAAYIIWIRSRIRVKVDPQMRVLGEREEKKRLKGRRGDKSKYDV